MMRKNTDGSRIDMQGSAERGYLMQLIDDAERIVVSDPLAEVISPEEYTLSQPEADVERKEDDFYRTVAACHLCKLCFDRNTFAHPVVKKAPKVLFITESPEGDMIFSPQSISVFSAFWRDSLKLREGEWALTTLMKCPGEWSRESADCCKPYIRKELVDIAPGAIVLMGMNGARYMLGDRGGDSAYLQRRFTVNHIPLYVTYSPAEYSEDRNLRKSIWDNLVFIRGELGLDAVR